jgi:hypothetical protein
MDVTSHLRCTCRPEWAGLKNNYAIYFTTLSSSPYSAAGPDCAFAELQSFDCRRGVDGKAERKDIRG